MFEPIAHGINSMVNVENLQQLNYEQRIVSMLDFNRSQVVKLVLRPGSSICNVDADIQPKSKPNLNPRAAMSPVVSKRKVMQATTIKLINRIWGEYYSSHLLEGIGEETRYFFMIFFVFVNPSVSSSHLEILHESCHNLDRI